MAINVEGNPSTLQETASASTSFQGTNIALGSLVALTRYRGATEHYEQKIEHFIGRLHRETGWLVHLADVSLEVCDGELRQTAHHDLILDLENQTSDLDFEVIENPQPAESHSHLRIVK